MTNPPAGATKGESAESADQRGKRAEDDILPESAHKQIGKQTADGQTRHRLGHKNGQNTKRLRDPTLDAEGQHPRVQAKDMADHGQDHVKRSDERTAAKAAQSD